MSKSHRQWRESTTNSEPIVEVQNLKKHYPITKGVLKKEVGRVKAVDGISFTVHPGETLGLVGESGCGKSTAATTLLHLEEPTEGEIIFEGNDITEYDDTELKLLRRRAQMIFQNPESSFDPRMSVGDSIGEPLQIHGMRELSKRREIVTDLLERVGLSADDANRFPHEFSGGEKQRIALARALVLNPDLIVADEPVSALDVSVQAEIIDLIDEIQRKFDLGILFISHDMGVIREVCDRVAVMYLGEIVENGPVEEIFENPQHPYTRALLSAIPEPDPRERDLGAQLTGDVPSPSDPPSGCRFHTRCPEVIQPEGYDFSQENWRAVMTFRDRVKTQNIDVDAAREFIVTESNELQDPTDVTREGLETVIREEFDIPEQLPNEAAESVLSEVFEYVIDGDFQRANGLLAEEFPTVCEQHHPALKETDAGHPAACYLHDQSVVTESVEQPNQVDD